MRNTFGARLNRPEQFTFTIDSVRLQRLLAASMCDYYPSYTQDHNQQSCMPANKGLAYISLPSCSLVPRPHPKNRKRGLVALRVFPVANVNIIKRVLWYDMPYCNHWFQLTIMQICTRRSKSELKKQCCSMLSFVFICHKFRQVISIGTQACANRWSGSLSR